MKFQALSAVSVLAATVSAHGYVDNITIAGTVYTVSLISPYYLHEQTEQRLTSHRATNPTKTPTPPPSPIE